MSLAGRGNVLGPLGAGWPCCRLRVEVPNEASIMRARSGTRRGDEDVDNGPVPRPIDF